ncbi:hypothetical protein TVAG_078280 [Trichomonas vaginalis G3]|uniref:Uncharacterized protein n=1 Tax=Trichomonas vaginalis (strain ATCC PRA-98 / G3) TaxID=412133 RepID=A2FY95_TRIV3|nr:rRNA processing [Trichomonas vaginalis G3]EAX90117.1 hypothetical protein TVAG_078280 [Trichomonas vaginalis G3]KAI5533817.1 rRNA processing [Trichomonas vaginalis G3]|eukprot:XP_001303047.1 hypothetical protein [Trichomonas vaginalis G3]
MSNDELIEQAAQTLVEEGVDLSKIPSSNKNKQEFLSLVKQYLNSNLNSLQKARIEYLVGNMTELYKREVEKEEKAKAREIAEEKRKKKEKEHKMLNRRTKRGQPVLCGLARLQLEKVQQMIENDKKK